MRTTKIHERFEGKVLDAILKKRSFRIFTPIVLHML